MIRKLLVFVTVLMFPWGMLHADSFGFEIGAGVWEQDADGSIETNDIPEFTLDKGESATILWANLEHPVPVLPNLRVAMAPVNSSNSAGDELNMDTTDITLYYELLDNWFQLDLGLTGRMIDGTAKTSTEEDDVSGVIPMVYGKAAIDLPITGLSIGTEINAIGVYNDIALYAAYEFDFGLGFQAGKRTMNIDFDENDVASSLKNDGWYLAGYFHF